MKISKQVIMLGVLGLCLFGFRLQGVSATENVTLDNSCIEDGVVVSKMMNWKQRKQLFLEGKITDCTGKRWNIRIIPGAKKSGEIIVDAFEDAADISDDLLKKETYTDMGETIADGMKDGWTFTGDSTEYALEGVKDIFVEGVYETFIKDTIEAYNDGIKDSRELDGAIGSTITSVYLIAVEPTAELLWNAVKTVLWYTPKGLYKSIVGTVGMVSGAAFTVTSPVLVPAVQIIGRPVLSLGTIALNGVVVPGTYFVWNGAGWLSTQLSKTPTKETRVAGISFVRLENPDLPEPVEMKVTMDNFSSILESSVLEEMSDEKSGVVNNEIAEIRKQILVLEKKKKELQSRLREIRNELASNEVIKAVNTLRSEAWRADIVTHVNGVKELVVNDEALTELVYEYVEQIDASLSSEQVEAVVEDIKKKLSTSFKEKKN